MDIANHFLLGLQVTLQPMNLLYCFLGVFIGTLIGVLPGIGPIGRIRFNGSRQWPLVSPTS